MTDGITRRSALLLGGSLVAAAPARAAESSWDRIVRTGTVRIGVIPSRPPYFWQENGQWTGFSAQMGRDAAEALSGAAKRPVTVAFTETSWPTVVLDLQAGRVDVFFGLSYSEQRAKALDLFGPLYSLPEVALNRSGVDPGDQWSAYDKPGVKIVDVIGTTDAAAAHKLLPHAALTDLKSMEDAVLALQSAHADTLITTLLVALGATREAANIGKVQLLQPLYTQPSYGGTRLDGDRRLGRFLQDWAKDYRASGRARDVILAAMRQYGLDTDHLPPEMAF